MTEPVLRLVLSDDDPENAIPDAQAADTRTDAPADVKGDARADGGADSEADALPVMPGLTVTRGDIAAVAVRHWASMIAASARKTMTHPGTVITDEPPSIAHLLAYYRAAAWVPDKASAEALAFAGRAYGYCVGIPLTALFYSLAWLFARPARIGLVLIAASAVTIAALA